MKNLMQKETRQVSGGLLVGPGIKPDWVNPKPPKPVPPNTPPKPTPPPKPKK